MTKLCGVLLLGLSGLFLSVCLVSAGETPAFTRSVIVFNTICAKCHEAQCSGRLSFDDAFERSRNHILRHYHQASGKKHLQKELFDILGYMKENCAYYPMHFSIPSNRIWVNDILQKYRAGRDGNYFIPVGHLDSGYYRIKLELKKEAKVTVHLISEQFEMAVDDCYQSTERQIKIAVFIEDSGDYYLRLYPKEPVRLIRLTMTPEKN